MDDKLRKITINKVEWNEVVSDLSSIIKNARVEMKLTQEEVAEILVVSVRQYQRYENGEKGMAEAPFQVAISICELLHLDPHEFVTSLADIEEFDMARPGVYEDTK